MSISARSIVLISALLRLAHATTITILPATNIAQATTDRNTWLVETFGSGTKPDPVQVDIDNVSPQKSEVKTLQLLTSFHSLYFFLTGVESNVQIRTGDGTITRVHDGDNSIYFVGIASSTAIGSLQWRSSDSFELSDFGVPQTPAQAPEPAITLLTATGLILMRLLWKRPSRPPTKPNGNNPRRRSFACPFQPPV